MLTLTWRDRLISKIGVIIFRWTRVKCGPMMCDVPGGWLYLDPFGQVWHVKPEFGYRHSPLVITKVLEV